MRNDILVIAVAVAVTVLCFFLFGCTSALAPAALVIPPDLQSCPAGAPVPPAPPLPRTTESIAAAYNAVKLVAEKNEAARAECADRLGKLNRLVSP